MDLKLDVKTEGEKVITYYEIDYLMNVMRRFNLVKDRKSNTEEYVNTDKLNFSFDLEIFEKEITQEKFTQLIIQNSKNEFELYISESEGNKNLINILRENYCYIDDSKKYLKEELKNIYYLLREKKFLDNDIEILKTNGWDLDEKKYILNNLRIFDKNIEDKTSYMQSMKYFLENEESIVVSITDKFFNLLPFNTFPFVRNFYGTKDTGKTTTEIISQSIFRKPEVLNSISQASLEHTKSTSKNYFIALDEFHLKGNDSNLVYNLANDMVHQRMERSSTGWTNKSRGSCFITSTLIGETKYVYKHGGEADRIYYYEMKPREFNSDYNIHMNNIHILMKSNYGVLIDEIVEFIESKFDDIENFFKTIDGDRKEKTIQVYQLAYNIMSEFFKEKYNINVLDINKHIKSYHQSSDDENAENVLSILQELLNVFRKYNNQYIEVYHKGRQQSLGFIKDIKEEKTLCLFKSNKNINMFCDIFGIDQSILKREFTEELTYKTSAKDFNNIPVSVYKIPLSLLNELYNIYSAKEDEVIIDNEDIPKDEDMPF